MGHGKNDSGPRAGLTLGLLLVGSRTWQGILDNAIVATPQGNRTLLPAKHILFGGNFSLHARVIVLRHREELSAFGCATGGNTHGCIRSPRAPRLLIKKLSGFPVTFE